MGHGKETPRQKMVGMMYLVLTALLALNVSKSVLDAFVLVDEGLNKTVENFSSKSEILYSKLTQANTTNPAAAGPFFEKAMSVKQRTEELSRYIDELKVRLIKIADKVEVSPDTVGRYELMSKDNTDIGGQVMIVEGKGKELKEKIAEFREYLKGLAEEEAGKGLREQLDKGLNTSDPDKPNKGGQYEKWEQAKFEHLPLVAVTTMMTKLQTDIRNAEADVVSYLASQIGADDFRFNKIEAIVKAESNYVLVGDQYKAEVFIAASDTTVQPTILVGGRELTVKHGKAQYVAAATAVGPKTWSGVIKLETPSTKTVKEYPFKAEYQVAEPSVTVSPTKMNVFYIGVDNPVDILASGIPADKVDPSISSGAIVRSSKAGEYTVRVKKAGKAVITVWAEIAGKRVNMGTKEFRVKTVPDPVAMVGGQKDGIIAKNMLQAQAGVSAVLENFDFDMKFVVQSFTVSATIRGYEEEERSSSYAFTAGQKQLIGKLTPNSKVYITDIKAKGPDGTIRSLPSIAFKLK